MVFDSLEFKEKEWIYKDRKNREEINCMSLKELINYLSCYWLYVAKLGKRKYNKRVKEITLAFNMNKKAEAFPYGNS